MIMSQGFKTQGSPKCEWEFEVSSILKYNLQKIWYEAREFYEEFAQFNLRDFWCSKVWEENEVYLLLYFKENKREKQ